MYWGVLSRVCCGVRSGLPASGSCNLNKLSRSETQKIVLNDGNFPIDVGTTGAVALLQGARRVRRLDCIEAAPGMWRLKRTHKKKHKKNSTRSAAVQGTGRTACGRGASSALPSTATPPPPWRAIRGPCGQRWLQGTPRNSWSPPMPTCAATVDRAPLFTPE